jgi:hypothetical protein
MLVPHRERSYLPSESLKQTQGKTQVRNVVTDPFGSWSPVPPLDMLRAVKYYDLLSR